MPGEIVGRRAEDGDFVSFREAIKLFATKEEVAAMGDSIATMQRRIETLPTRDETAGHWQRDDERWTESSKQSDDFRKDTTAKLDALPGNILRAVSTVVGLITAVGGIIAYLIAHH